MHRYVFTLFEQTSKDLGSKLEASLGPALREKGLNIGERATMLPLLKFAEENSLTWRGFGFVTSVWSKSTPEIYQGLGMHEPMYGKSTTKKAHILHRQKATVKPIEKLVTRRQLKIVSGEKYQAPSRDGRRHVIFQNNEPVPRKSRYE